MMLAEAGIRTVEELREIGAVKAYVRVKQIRNRGVSLNLLYSIAAGLDNRGWQELSEEEKTKLASEAKALQR
jgi:DNA transformation protein